jgi:hypothetical protein
MSGRDAREAVGSRLRAVGKMRSADIRRRLRIRNGKFDSTFGLIEMSSFLGLAHRAQRVQAAMLPEAA